MSDIKQVKVDNWGIYFLQRLKHFFNRTDYCDLTLQFQDNAQLKVHRLVLSACTEYFELLERTCEMYEDCLVMPDDLQADVVVPIVNFMYTGQLEFKMELLESLYQTSLIMNMPVLTKLLDAHRSEAVKPLLNYASTKRSYSKSTPSIKPKQTPVPSSSGVSKRSYSNAFGISTASVSYGSSREKKQYSQDPIPNNIRITPPKASPVFNPRLSLKEPRPTRYELPEDLDSDNIFDDSFSNISYTSQPLMVHPETSKQYASNRSIFDEASGSKRIGRTSTMDIVECKKLTKSNNIFEDDDVNCMSENADYEPPSDKSVKNEVKVTNHLFDEILDSETGPKVSIETKNSKQAAGIDHAKIISEVLKKYPHLVKTNKNIKLKILNTPSPKASAPSPPIKSQTRRRKPSPIPYTEEKVKQEKPDYTYETDVLDSKEAARLIALGAENIHGPWICLICGTPGKALHFTSYYKFRRHLVEVHNEKPASKICEYCGLKSLKRNYLLHHLYTKHGVEPPPQYNFPKCNMCTYVALTEAFLIKHKLSHTRNFRCNVCASAYSTSSELLVHIQSTGHKYTADRKNNLQCIYCLKVFLRETNLFTHLKTNHKKAAIADGIIEESDDDEKDVKPSFMKYELPYDNVQEENTESQFQIQQGADGNIKLVPTKQHAVAATPTKKQKILNIGLHVPARKPSPSKPKPTRTESNAEFEFSAEVLSNNNQTEEIVMIDNNEYVMRNNQLIPRKKTSPEEDFIISDMANEEVSIQPMAMEFCGINNVISENTVQQKVTSNKSGNVSQPIQIVVSNEEEYKALMNSNHSIIFDDGDTNKTLTVLSTPHTTGINTAAIDLDNTSDDMMIIQENYPLAVSESLPGSNSNIVVVYSHAVDDQNKEYQLLTSQDIGEQFVQSSSVISQNYATITTTTPVINDMTTQAAETWQNNIQDNINQEVTVNELQEMEIDNQAEVNQNESIVESCELPEVTLTPTNSQIITTDQDPKVGIQSKDTENKIESTEQIVVEQVDNSVTAIDIESHDAEIESNTIIAASNDITGPNDSNPQSNIQPTILDAEKELIHCASIVEEGIEEHDTECEEPLNESQIIETIENSEIVEETETVENPEIVEETEDIVIQTVHNSNTAPTVIKEQIQTLASEWSEDDEDSQTAEPGQDNETVTHKVAEVNTETTETPAEMEESIENIQQEMAKQITEVAQDDETEKSVEEQSADLKVTTKPLEKISSLLNDWDENDSQEEEESLNADSASDIVNTDAVSQPKVSDENREITPKSDSAEDKNSEQKNDDKIKSLVSDWDEEEDENKS